MSTYMKGHDAIYSLKYLISEPREPIMSLMCLINGCKRVEKVVLS